MRKVLRIPGLVALALAALSSARVEAATIAAGTDHSLGIKDDGSVWAWGANAKGQLGNGTTSPSQVPVQVSGFPLGTVIVAVSAGQSFSVALDSLGNVFTWGDNIAKQLGDGGSSTTRTSPYQITTLTNVIAIDAGQQFVLALKDDGTIWSWGKNATGQLGDGTGTQRSSPVHVLDSSGIGSLSNVTAITAGGFHSLAVKSDGSVWAWGKNVSGQLGNNASGVQSLIPVRVKDTAGTGWFANASALAAGADCSLALKTNGEVWAWGINTNGQLGDNGTTQRTTPSQVHGALNSGFLTGVGAIATGDSHSLAIKTDGTAWAWGKNGSGQMGINSLTPASQTVPIQVKGSGGVGNLVSVVAIAGGTSHSLAVQSGSPGTAWAWGLNSSGQLGDSSLVQRPAPVQVSGSGFVWMVATPTFTPGQGTYGVPQSVTIRTTTPGAQIWYTADGSVPTNGAPSIFYTSAVTVNATTTLRAKAWAGVLSPSNVGQAAYALKVATPSFNPVAGTYVAAQSVAISATTPGAAIYYTKNGSEPSQGSTPYTAPISVGTATTVKAKAFKQDWTESDTGTATYSFNFGTLSPPPLSPASGTYLAAATVTMSALAGASIYYTMDGTTPSQSSSLYTGPLTVDISMTLKAKAFHPDWTASATTTATYTIVPFVGPPTFDVTPGAYVTRQTVHITTASPGVVLHYTTSGVNPTLADPTVPTGGVTVDRAMIVKANGWNSGFLVTPVARADYRITGAVAAGWYHSLALEEDGTVLSSGDNGLGQLGVSTSTPKRSSFAAVANLPAARAIAAGAYHSLVLGSDGSVWAFGSNSAGQLGLANDAQPHPQPVQVTAGALAGVQAMAVAAGRDSSYAIRATDGAVIAWGEITGSTSGTPVVIPGLTQIVALAPGWTHCLALKADGTVYAWGANNYGQVGNGNFNTPIATPVVVGSLTGVARIAASSLSSFALKTDGQRSGTTWAWGNAWNGELGDGGVVARNAPWSGLANTMVVGAGAFHVLASTVDGKTWGWGLNDAYGLGDGTSLQRQRPVQIRGMNDAVAFAGGYRFTLALRTDGSVWGSGEAYSGQLGDGVGTNPRQTPFKAPGISLAANDWMLLDSDSDGLSNAAEYRYGTDPLDPDSNRDGLSDGVEVALGKDPSALDSDGDGLTNVQERALGTDPFKADTDGDGVPDGADAYPFDPTRWSAPPLDPSDHTPPTITILEPANATLLP